MLIVVGSLPAKDSWNPSHADWHRSGGCPNAAQLFRRSVCKALGVRSATLRARMIVKSAGYIFAEEVFNGGQRVRVSGGLVFLLYTTVYSNTTLATIWHCA